VRLSGFTIVRDGVRCGYPFVESIRSVLPLVDEMIVGVGDCDDGTWETVLAIGDPKIAPFRSVWNPELRVGGEELSRQTNLALDRCTGAWAIYLQADEVLHERDYDRLRDALTRHASRRTEGLLFDYLHFYGSYHTVRRGWHPYPRAVRAVKVGIGVRSIGDAAGFHVVRGGVSRGLIKARTGARIFHYGFCRPPAQQVAKRVAQSRLHEEYGDFDTDPRPEVLFGQPDQLARFEGSHPVVMQALVASQSWHYDPELPGVRRRAAAWLRDMRSVSARDKTTRLAPLAATNLWWRAVDALGGGTAGAVAARSTAVVVLGDLGRSPRMLYHATALADVVGDVDLVGYVETTLDASVADDPRIRVHAIPAPATRLPRPLFVVHGLWRAAAQTIGVLWRLLRIPRPRTILVQNPPAIPTLAVALVAARLRGARLVVDWHNFGDSMLVLRLGTGHPVVRLAHRWERTFGRRADAHLCVSEAMRAELSARWGIPDAVVLPDRPAERFAPLDRAGRERVRACWAREIGLEPGRPTALVVSPIGWTADEDVGLLVEAAGRYDDAADRDRDAYPDLVVVLTGDGPLRDEWLPRLASAELGRVRLRALWLEPGDYPEFVAAADLGLSLHRSTSGVDLPMKVADLLGAGVPVCALDYGPCLREMLVQGETGRFFSSAGELADVLLALFRNHPDDAGPLARLRAGVARTTGERWRGTWMRVARPIFEVGPAC
jgi:beta-1,4-mannosyltransferase